MCPPSAFKQASSGQSSKLDDADFPTTKIVKDAFEVAISTLPTPILNHSIRVYKYARRLAERSNSQYFHDEAKHDLLFVSCLFHDFGATEKHNGPNRFEIEGGDAAVSFLKGHGVSDESAHEAWMAIVLHTSPIIAERINELCRIVRLAVLVDFHRKEESLEDTSELRPIFEKTYPRLEIEKVLGDAVAHQAAKNPQKAPAASWANNLYLAYLAEPDWEGVNKGF